MMAKMPPSIKIVDKLTPQHQLFLSAIARSGGVRSVRIELSEPAPAHRDRTTQHHTLQRTTRHEKTPETSDPSSIDKITQLLGPTTVKLGLHQGRPQEALFKLWFCCGQPDKSFTIGLSSGDGYVPDESSLNNRATVQIINNDVAGSSSCSQESCKSARPTVVLSRLAESTERRCLPDTGRAESEINGTSASSWVPQTRIQPNTQFHIRIGLLHKKSPSPPMTTTSLKIQAAAETVTYNSNGKPVDINGAEITNPELLLTRPHQRN